MELLEQTHCHPKAELGDCVGKVLALDGSVLQPQVQHLETQLWLATHGKGCYEGYQDTTIYVTSLYNEIETSFKREQFLGEVKEECLPKYAKDMRDLLLPRCHDEAFYLRARAIPFEIHKESRILSQYEKTVLTVNMTPEKEVTFSVCEYDEDNKYLSEGLGYGSNLEGAKEKFSVLAGLISSNFILHDEAKYILLNSLEFAMEEGMEMEWDEQEEAEEMIFLLKEDLGLVLQEEVFEQQCSVEEDQDR